MAEFPETINFFKEQMAQAREKIGLIAPSLPPTPEQEKLPKIVQTHPKVMERLNGLLTEMFVAGIAGTAEIDLQKIKVDDLWVTEPQPGERRACIECGDTELAAEMVPVNWLEPVHFEGQLSGLELCTSGQRCRHCHAHFG